MSRPAHAAACPHCGHTGRPWCRDMCTRCYRRWHRAGFPAAGPPAPWEPSASDEIAIQRAMDGHRLRLTPLERREAARRLDRRGHTRAEIAERLGCCTRTVERAIYPRQVA